MCGTLAHATVVLPHREDHQMAGINEFFTGSLPYDNSALRARLADMPVRATSIEAELRAVMAERHEPETPVRKSKRRSRWE
jgi:hypothetical protein